MFFNTELSPIQTGWGILPEQTFFMKTNFVKGVRMYDTCEIVHLL